MKLDVPIHFWIGEKMKESLYQMASDDDKSVAAFMRQLIEDEQARREKSEAP